MGLHTAELVAGEIGSAERGTYGVVGDGMNLASRLEGANKVYGTRAIVSDVTRAQAGPEFATRELDLVRVVGRRAPVRIYELVGSAASLDERARRALEVYELALVGYRARDFAAAQRALDALHELAPDDRPAAWLAERVRAFSAVPPAPDWDGVFALETK
jgi:adenylate cyclase